MGRRADYNLDVNYLVGYDLLDLEIVTESPIGDYKEGYDSLVVDHETVDECSTPDYSLAQRSSNSC